MINRWFRGTLGKVAGLGYSIGAVLIAVSLLLSAQPTSVVLAQGNPGSIKTTTGECGSPVNKNHYSAGDSIVIHGESFDPNTTYSWDITGTPGSNDPNIVVASGNVTSDGEGNFCIEAYTVEADDGGEYKVTVGSKGDNYRVVQAPTSTPSSTPTSSPVPPSNTPVEPSNTPTNSPVPPTTNTPTDTPLPPTSTPSLTPTNTPIDTATSPPTDTPDPGVTPTDTNTPTTTPEPPNLVDPKEDSLLTDNDGNGVPSPGDVLLYTMTISNSGGSAATGVVFSDSPDSNTSLVAGSVTTTQGTVTSGNSGGDTSVAVDIGTIGAGETVTITFQVTINLGIPSSVTSVANQGLVSGGNIDSSFTDDPDTAEADDPTVTELFVPTATPDPTSGPGPTNTPVPATTPSVLIPVTGVEHPTTTGAAATAGILQNIGLGLLGLSLVVHSFSLGRKEED